MIAAWQLVVVALVAASIVVDGSALPVTVCVTCRVDRTPHSLHAEFAARHYAHEYPQLNVTTRFVGRYEAGGTTQRGLIRAFVEHADSCDVVVGPGSSSIAVALNPLVDGAWIDYSATSTELSSRFDFPLFNRVVPTDEDATRGYAPLLRAAGWRSVDLICASTAYGQSVAAGFAAVMSDLGGQLHATPCVDVDADEAVMDAQIDAVVARGSRVVFVGLASSYPAFAAFIRAARERRASEHLVFLFSEGACSAVSQPWAALHGAFCATFALQAEALRSFVAAYEARDVRPATAAYAAMGWPAGGVMLSGSGVFPAYAADATRFALRALAAAAERFDPPRLPAKGEARAAALRDFNMSGITGEIAIPTGDRPAAAMVLYNSRADRSHALAANISATGSMSAAPSFFVLGEWVTLSSIPRFDAAPVRQGGGPSVEIGVGVGVAAAVLIATLVIALVRRWWRRGLRNNACAPQDASEPFAMLFTDIQGSTSQWAAHPEAFGPAVDTHHAVLRAAVARHGGYEVKTIGDAFMVAFADAGAAVACAVDAQEALFAAAWPSCIDALYRAQAAEAGLPSARLSEGAYAEQWAGVRVRIGVHYGLGEIKLDPVSQGYDYYGTVVNTAARVEGVAHGGQVLVSAAALAAAGGVGGVRGAVVSALGPQPLRGLAEPVELFQVLPTTFAQREFPPLRLDVEARIDDEDEGDEATTAAGGPEASYMSGGSSAPSSARSSTGCIIDVTTGRPTRIPKAAPEFVCQQAARRVEGATFEGMVFQYHVLKAVVSTLPAADRSKTVLALAEQWRIAEVKSLKNARTDAEKAKQTDRTLALLAARAAPVAARYKSPYASSKPQAGAAVASEPTLHIMGASDLATSIKAGSGRSPRALRSPAALASTKADGMWSPSNVPVEAPSTSTEHPCAIPLETPQ